MQHATPQRTSYRRPPLHSSPEFGICYADYLHERSAVPQADFTEQVLANLLPEPLGQAMTYSGVKGLFDRGERYRRQTRRDSRGKPD